MIDFPASPVPDQLYVAPNGVTYQWHASITAWVVYEDTGGVVSVSAGPGIAITGTASDPVVGLQDIDASGIFGDASNVPQITVDEYGRVTNVDLVPITGGGGGSFQPLDADLTAIAALTTQAFGRSVLEQADAAAARTLLGAQVAGSYQPLDNDLTAVAAVATKTFGRSLLTPNDATEARTLLNAQIAGSYQPLDSDLTDIAALTTVAFGRSFLTLADAAAALALIGAQPAGSYQPLDSDLTAIAALATTAFGRSFLALVDAAAALTLIGAQPAGSYQPLDSDLTSIAALTTTAFGRSFLALADAAAARTLIDLVPATVAEIRAGTAGNKPITAANRAAADVIVALTDAATIAVDMATFINAEVTLAGNRTLGAPTNTQVGRWGSLDVIQSAGGNTLAFHANYKFPAGVPPAMSAAAGARDKLTYFVRTSTVIDIFFPGPAMA